jgi:energy-coupling factor transporter ATP-binding protein EcfA2
MKYKYSQVDKDNMAWFEHDMTKATLSEIGLHRGNLRGLSSFHIKFTYPISVIAGLNRSGKSTILAMAACAFHNNKKGFKLPERKLTYYTFSDFFIQTSEEVPQDGIEILCRIRHNHWRKSPHAPEGIGNLLQRRKKKKGGKWNKYANRVRRNVIFFGIQRVVPPAEKSVSKSYKTYFSIGAPDGWEDEVKTVVGRIIGTEYDGFCMKTHGKYRLPLVYSGDTIYSGFNMGAGENALFEIFSTIFASPPGTLLVIDEIELGLHESAQKKLIKELKKLCRDRHIQVICTTHSSAILETVPPEGRLFVESFPGKTNIIPGISPRYASGKLSGEKSNELDIYVEDRLASHIIEASLVNDIRERIAIIPIGSSIAIIRQMAGRYKHQLKAECVGVMDGDQSDLLTQHIGQFIKALEMSKEPDHEIEWFKSRLAFLPGKTWPEQWMVNKLKSLDISSFAKICGTTNEKLNSYLDEALSAEKHNELHILAKKLSLDSENVCCMIARWLSENTPEDFYPLNEVIRTLLP